MSYETFVREIEEKVRCRMNGQREIYVRSSRKNNGCERKGITFVEEGVNVSPTIYLEEYYEQYRQGLKPDEIAGRIIELYWEVRINHSWEGGFVRVYGNVRDRIIYRLISRERNQDLLKEVPHKEYLDLAVLFYVLVEIKEEKERLATMLIQKEHLKWWNINEEELYLRASINTAELLPYEFCSVNSIMEDLLGRQNSANERGEGEAEEFLYVLTNQARNCGASAILYPNRLEMIGKCFGENYYVLPSSIHEVLILPESSGISREEAGEIVREVNGSYVKGEDILSDQVYYYDREKKELVM